MEIHSQAFDNERGHFTPELWGAGWRPRSSRLFFVEFSVNGVDKVLEHVRRFLNESPARLADILSSQAPAEPTPTNEAPLLPSANPSLKELRLEALARRQQRERELANPPPQGPHAGNNFPPQQDRALPSPFVFFLFISHLEFVASFSGDEIKSVDPQEWQCCRGHHD